MSRRDQIKLIAELVADERAACAALCREAGCICFDLYRARAFDGDYEGELEVRSDFRIIRHDSSCPEALASRIEARGGERKGGPDA